MKLLNTMRTLSLISFVVKSNIALGLAWYGNFYSVKEATKSADPFIWASLGSLCVTGFIQLYINEQKGKA